MGEREILLEALVYNTPNNDKGKWSKRRVSDSCPQGLIVDLVKLGKLMKKKLAEFNLLELKAKCEQLLSENVFNLNKGEQQKELMFIVFRAGNMYDEDFQKVYEQILEGQSLSHREAASKEDRRARAGSSLH